MDPWLKAAHVFAVISWMAGLLYLPRLFVYHAMQKPGSEAGETFKIMEARLLRIIMNPSLAAVWITGPWLAWRLNVHLDYWLWAKVLLVVALTAFHMFLARTRRLFAEDRNERPDRFYRMINEVPALFLAAIVVLVVVRPF